MQWGWSGFRRRPYPKTDIEGSKSTPQLSSGMRLDIRDIEEGIQAVDKIVSKIQKEGIFTLDFDKDGRWFVQVVLLYDRNVERLGIAELEYPLSSINPEHRGIVRLQQSSILFGAISNVVESLKESGAFGKDILSLLDSVTEQDGLEHTIEGLKGRWRLYIKNIQDGVGDVYAPDLNLMLKPWIMNGFIPEDVALQIMMGSTMWRWLFDPGEESKEAVVIKFNQSFDVEEYILVGYPDIKKRAC